MSLANKLKRVLLKPILRMVQRLNDGQHDYRELRLGVARFDRWLSVDIPDLMRSTLVLEHCTATWFELPHTRPDQVILYLHGGGFIFETPGLHAGMLARFCRDTGARGLMLNYRLAPEFPYPAATEDCLAAYRHLLDIGYAANKIVIAGDSAGGNLTLVTLLRIREAGLPLPAGAIALSPLTDATGASHSFLRNQKHDPMFTANTYKLVMDNYLPEVARRSEPWASPLFGNLDGLPPIHLVVGSSEIMLDESVRFACKCPSATLDVWHDMPHVFPAISFLPEAEQALVRLAVCFNAKFSGATSLDSMLHQAVGDQHIAGAKRFNTTITALGLSLVVLAAIGAAVAAFYL